MHTGPQYTSPQQPGGPGGGRSGALLIGGITFAIVFLLIVGLTVAFLVVRTTTSGGEETATATSSSAEESTPTEPTGDPTDTGEATASPTAEKERCWNPERTRESSNPSGRLRGGGLQFIPPSGFDGRAPLNYGAFLTDGQVALATIEGDWTSNVGVAAVEWQPGYEYPGNKAASERILECMYSDSTMWGDTSQRSLEDQVTEPVTVAGMPGYRTSAVLTFGQHSFEKFESTKLVVVVVDTPQGPSAFIADIAVGVTEHEEGYEEAYASVTGHSG